MFRRKHAAATEHYCMPGTQSDPRKQRGHVQQNQHPDAIAAAQAGSPNEQRDAYAADDPRYAGGDVVSSWDDEQPA